MPVGVAFEGWDVADLAVEAGRVVPVDPFHGGSHRHQVVLGEELFGARVVPAVERRALPFHLR